MKYLRLVRFYPGRKVLSHGSLGSAPGGCLILPSTDLPCAFSGSPLGRQGREQLDYPVYHVEEDTHGSRIQKGIELRDRLGGQVVLEEQHDRRIDRKDQEDLAYPCEVPDQPLGDAHALGPEGLYQRQE